MKNYPTFEGTVTELITPFSSDGKLDYQLLANEAEYQINAGVAGLFTNGVASEVFYLSPEEQIEATRTVVKQANGRIKIMANVAANTMIESKQILEAYEIIGVDAISLQAPTIHAISQDSLFDYFNTLAKSTKLPICIYNAPQTGNVISPETVARIFHENQNVVYYKESTIDFVHVQNTLRLIGPDKKIEFFSGSDASTFLIANLGGKGVVSLISAVFPKQVKAIYDAYSIGDLVAAQNAQNFVLEIRDALKSAPFLAGYKYAGSLVGIPLGTVRYPLSDATDSQKETIKNNLNKLGLL